MSAYTEILTELHDQGNLRTLPGQRPEGLVDLSSNDYLGLAADAGLRSSFFDTVDVERLGMSASASRLLAAEQGEFAAFEALLADLYGGGREALIFNSGYHANTGLISALASAVSGTVIVADKLVHASIIDGAILSRARLVRFRHNDYDHLDRIMQSDEVARARQVIVVAEGVYSMDGDRCSVERLAAAKARSAAPALLYIDEAHSVGCLGPGGLGLVHGSPWREDVDVVVGTLGKALASVGAYAVMAPELKRYAINRARSLIFSTALPPLSVAWSCFVMERLGGMEGRRSHLMALAGELASALGAAQDADSQRYIYPHIVGSASAAVQLAQTLAQQGYAVLPIRTPTVPAGTERLRISLTASLPLSTVSRFGQTLSSLCART